MGPPGGWAVSFRIRSSAFNSCTSSPLSHGSRIGRYGSNPVVGHPSTGSGRRRRGDAGTGRQEQSPRSDLGERRRASVHCLGAEMEKGETPTEAPIPLVRPRPFGDNLRELTVSGETVPLGENREPHLDQVRSTRRRTRELGV